MSTLFTKIQTDLKTALKEKNQLRVLTLRMLISEIKNEEIAQKKKEGLKDEEIQKVILRAVRRHKDSIESYRKGGRDDLVKKEEDELKILQSYLPKPLTVAEVEKIVDEVILQIGAKNFSDFGKVMKEVMKKVNGRAEGRLVSEIVKKKLSSQK